MKNLKNINVVLVLLSVVASIQAFGNAYCAEKVANAVAADLAKQRYANLELRPQRIPLRGVLKEIPILSKAVRDNLHVLAKQLEFTSRTVGTAKPRSLSFDGAFTAATFSRPHKSADHVTEVVALNRVEGNKNLTLSTPLPRDATLSAISGKNATVVLVGSVRGGSEFNPGEKVLMGGFEHTKLVNPKQTERTRNNLGSTEFTHAAYKNASENGMLLSKEDGIAIFANEHNELRILLSGVKGSTGEVGASHFPILDSNGVPIVLGSAHYPRLSQGDFLLDPNTSTIAMKVHGSSQAEAEFNNVVKYRILELNQGIFKASDNTFSTVEPLANSFAYLPYTKIVAYRDEQGHFLIRHSHDESMSPLYVIRQPNPLQYRTRISPEVVEALQFPKVVSYENDQLGGFLILKADGHIETWDSNDGKIKEFKIHKKFNEKEQKAGSSEMPGMVDGVSVSRTAKLSALWSETHVKLFDPLTEKELMSWKVPESQRGKVKSIYFSPDASAYLIQFADNSSTLIETKTGEVVAIYGEKLTDQFANAFANYTLNYSRVLQE